MKEADDFDEFVRARWTATARLAYALTLDTESLAEEVPPAAVTSDGRTGWDVRNESMYPRKTRRNSTRRSSRNISRRSPTTTDLRNLAL